MKTENNIKKGVVLKYNLSEGIPQIVAKAKGDLLSKIIEIAENNNIEIYEDSDLVEVLDAFEVGDEIPPEMYKAVAEVIAYCYRVNSRLKAKIDGAMI